LLKITLKHGDLTDVLATLRFALLVKSLQWNMKIQCGTLCHRIFALFELFGAVFLFIWCGNGVPGACSSLRSTPSSADSNVTKLASALFYCCSLLGNNNMATNFQRFTSSYVMHFSACDCLAQTSLTGDAAIQWHSGVDSPKIFSGQKIWQSKIFDVRRATVFSSRYRLSKRKILLILKIWGSMPPYDTLFDTVWKEAWVNL